MRCPNCEAEVHVYDHFCVDCGASLPAGRGSENLEHTGSITAIIPTGTGTNSGPMAPVGSPSLAELPTGSALLVVHRGPGEGSEFSLNSDVLSVGRSPDSDVFLDDVTVSRRHAEFRRGSAGWSIRDVGSLNGTYVNRKRVEDHQLHGGDEVQIGKFRFVFLVSVEPKT
ncbi:MAG: FHA domain-containing protein [Candidatus Nanopelagicales bacterium]|nr:FHA domain-containing protein [Candidatus Nanopelagicales bacterium]